MVRGALIAALVVLGLGGARADDLPALFDVIDVAPDDILNVRRHPTAAAPVIGTLGPEATDIEILMRSEDGRWGLLNMGEGTGWASLRFVSRQPGQSPDDPPAIVACHGTEPFWSLDLADQTIFRTPEITRTLSTATLAPAIGRIRPWLLSAGDDEGAMQGVLSRQVCSDGMSDRQFGYRIDLIVGPGTLYTGCCTLVP